MPGIVLIAAAKRDGLLFRRALEQVAGEAAGPRGTGGHQILIGGRLHGVAVAAANDGLGRLEQIGECSSRLQAVSRV